jgi:CMP/dCMP kinase
MIISFAGAIGSGKSTIAEMISKKLNMPRYYMGSIMREIAKQKNMPFSDLMELCINDPSVDHDVDEYQTQLGKNQDNFVIEGRTSWYFIPHSLKIFLDVDEEESARRIFNDQQNKIRHNETSTITSVEEMVKSIKHRKQSEVERYKKYYGIDVYNYKNYDFVLDTTNLTIEEVYNKMLTFVKNYIDINVDKK